ncbi:preprotein translocase subunit SecA [Paraperlucidibaca baekdonensis]|uniref:Protein translocase subunit SecA n=1 Tax=Paraperlucidibaca baekdonensis TaxID=748120 RepID=A0A3E0H5H6_9GAMM|nr:preprotein translocase subunit SecA [Paraperlucidibaca baekdonensis]REH38783.1 preprotein translocase subunit SecA [Paraperlucidibaca baekdonensis]
MFSRLVHGLFGTKNERELKRMRQIVARINALETESDALSDAELQAKTASFKQRFAQGETLDALLPEAFAVCRTAAQRVLGMRHYDVQMIGGITLHEGRIAEMRTGEGKTLTATLPAYLNGLSGAGVHVVTVNDYLASRDAEWNRPLFEFLGLTIGVVRSQQPPDEKRAAYAADITYGTNNEFGFDYLRDNMAFRLEDRFQRGHAYALIDEVDSILIDEARTPLIISGASEDSSKLYTQINTLIPSLTRQAEEAVADGGHYWFDEKSRQVELTEAGHEFVEDRMVEMGLLAEGDSLYSPAHLSLLHHVHAALRGHVLFQRDVHYLVNNDEVVIVDEHTGRTMPGRRWSDGLHQAVEAKEGVTIQSENQTMASTTFQNLFRLYRKLSGMTGTADTEAAEFKQIYGLDVVVIPTHRPMVRQDLEDLVYLSPEEKYQAIVADIKAYREKGAPILVGTATIEASELLSHLLNKENISHQVLNAKFHEREADIIAQAGRSGTVTIATNMAGRGTDILLGGSWKAEADKLGEDITPAQREALIAAWEADHAKVMAAGGLHIVGSERHESRRIDNQLRGRAGRQGDPGVTRFYLSLEDDLMRIFASDRVKGMMKSLGMKPGEAIEHPWVSKSIEGAQRKVESRNFDIRKNLLKYDDVANEQRQAIYRQRDDILNSTDISENVSLIFSDVVAQVISQYIPPQSLDEQWDIAGLEQALQADFNHAMPVQQWLDDDNKLHEDGLRERIHTEVMSAWQAKRERMGATVASQLEKQLMLQVIDRHWKDHLAAMDYLRKGIHLRGYAQRNPEQEYKREAFELFEQLVDAVKLELVQTLSRLHVPTAEEVAAMEAQRAAEAQSMAMQYQHADARADTPAEPDNSVTPAQAEQAIAGAQQPAAQPFVRDGGKVGRNDPCPCGSGRKYKQCHGQLA